MLNSWVEAALHVQAPYSYMTSTSGRILGLLMATKCVLLPNNFSTTYTVAS